MSKSNKTTAGDITNELFRMAGQSVSRKTGETTVWVWSYKTNSEIEVPAITTERKINNVWLDGKPIAKSSRVKILEDQ